MPLIPAITLKATLEDIAGVPLPGAKLQITLCGFGSAQPAIAGTGTIDELTITATAAALGAISQLLWGNDVITPIGTFYCIQGIDAIGNYQWAQNYQLNGAGNRELSTLVPYNPNPIVSAGPQNSLVFGVIDGINTSFTLASVPAFALLFRNGIYQTPGIDYSLSGLTITYLVTAPLSTETHTAVTFAPSSSNTPAAVVVSGVINGINTAFTISTVPGALLLFRNGALMTPGGVDYTLAGTNITYTNPPIVGESHTGVIFAAGPTGVPTDTAISGVMNGINEIFTVPVVPVFLMLFFDGAFQTPGVDYTLAGATIIYLNYAPVPGDTHHALTFASI